MSQVKIGNRIPDFSAQSTGGEISRDSLLGSPAVLYFYPKDNTPGCTTEGQEFTTLKAEFDKADCRIYGISRDSLRSHQNFCDKFKFTFDLISDPEEQLCQLFDVIREKNMYGRKVKGIERSTFLVDAGGTLRQEWRKVKAKGHAKEVLAAVQSLT